MARKSKKGTISNDGDEGSNLSIIVSSRRSKEATHSESQRQRKDVQPAAAPKRSVKSNDPQPRRKTKSNRKHPKHDKQQVLKPVLMQKKKYGRKGAPLLAPGTCLLETYTITKMFAGGGFGQVFLAKNEERQITVAVKVEPKDHDPGRMILEQKVLGALKGTPNAPTLYASGCHGEINFIVMELLGPNLSDLRKKYKNQCLTLGSSLRATLQASSGLRTLHDVGFIHRDVKPTNFCIGFSGVQRRIIYLVDFGLSRQFRTSKGQLRKQRKVAAFRGTLKYVSINVHMKREQGPCDDFISLFYSGYELSEGVLPWKAQKDQLVVEQMKKNFKFEESAKRLPAHFKLFYEYLKPLTSQDELNYEYLQQIIRDSLPDKINDETLYDWEEPSIDGNTTGGTAGTQE